MEITIEHLPELRRLSRQITDSFLSATDKARRAREQANEAVKEAILCGSLLIQARALVPPRRWGYWLEQSCPAISRVTAHRWMHLAEASRVQNLAGCAGLRHAYILCGILPEPEPKETGEPNDAEGTLRIFRPLATLRERFEKAKVEAWPAPEKQRLIEELAPLAALYEALTNPTPHKESL